MHGRRWIVAERRFVDLVENADIAAVVHLVQQRAVTARGVRRAQHQEFGAEFDQPPIIAGRELEVGNGRVRGSVRIEREEGATAQLLIAAGMTELDTIGECLAAHDLDALDPRGRRQRAASGRKTQHCENEAAHARIVPSPPEPCHPQLQTKVVWKCADHDRSAASGGR